MSKNRKKDKSSVKLSANKSGNKSLASMKPTGPPEMPVSNEDWDNFYSQLNHDEPDEAPSSSMIGYMLSHLKPGVDLTRVPLPSWFLQKRSGLEAYSDFFKHPDEFIKIKEAPTPSRRMLQCLRWFLIGFNDYFAKLNFIAKKPFNSVLGETFISSFDPFENGKCGQSKTQENPGNPWPWTNPNELVYYGEQVSHHPPISAFYAESIDHHIEVSCALLTEAKFRGLYVRVKNKGHIIVNLIDHQEEYVIELPNGYGRSVMTTPWLEAGGKTYITCDKTGFKSEIEFFTKPMWSSDKARIKARVIAPPKPKASKSGKSKSDAKGDDLWVFEGHWNSQIFNEGESKNIAAQPWIDMESLKHFTMKTRQHLFQSAHESRKVWREVTWCIKNKFQEKANEYKLWVEEKQRKEATDREIRGVSFNFRMYDKTTDDAGWSLRQLLSKRLKQMPNRTDQQRSTTDDTATTEARDDMNTLLEIDNRTLNNIDSILPRESEV